MKKFFYHHLIEIDTIIIELEALDLTKEEKEELLMLAENNIHHRVIDVVLSELEDGDKKVFLALVLGGDHNEIWKMLSFKVVDAEEKIKKAAKELKNKILEDIKEARSK
jgi:hypothetical protein